MQFPSLVVLMDFWEAVESPKQSRRLLNRALKQLPAEEKGRILALARTGGFESQVEDVLRTNIFGVDVGGAFHMGLFVEGSVSWSLFSLFLADMLNASLTWNRQRVNHNCRPK